MRMWVSACAHIRSRQTCCKWWQFQNIEELVRSLSGEGAVFALVCVVARLVWFYRGEAAAVHSWLCAV